MKISEIVSTINLYDLEGSLDEAIEYLENLREKFLGKDLRLEISSYGSDGSEYLNCVYQRPENEKEIEARKLREKKQEEYELEQYNRLKKKYETK
jgi:hypothetical protein